MSKPRSGGDGPCDDEWWNDPNYEPTDEDYAELFREIGFRSIEYDDQPPPRRVEDVPPNDLL